MNETMEKRLEHIRRLLGQKNLLRWAVALGVCGVLLVLAAGWLGEPTQETPPTAEAVTRLSLEEELEQRLLPVVAAITGGKSDRVLVTLEGEAETVYATGETDDGTDYVIVKNADGSQSAVKLTELCPEIRGVVVATARAEDALIRERIVAAVTTAFGIPSSRVCVVLSN